ALKYRFVEVKAASDIPDEEQESLDNDSEDLEYDDLKPLYHEAVATTNSADGSLQNSLIIKSIRHIIYNSLFDY
ncbi:2656_t:CDS:2, partial [Racocetra fulgida]